MLSRRSGRRALGLSESRGRRASVRTPSGFLLGPSRRVIRTESWALHLWSEVQSGAPSRRCPTAGHSSSDRASNHNLLRDEAAMSDSAVLEAPDVLLQLSADLEARRLAEIRELAQRTPKPWWH